MFRKSLFWLHLIAGVVAGLVILVMSVTGFLLMYERQIVAFAERNLVAPAAPGAVRLTPEELVAKVQESGSPLPTSITFQNKENAPVRFSYGREKAFFVDPYTGANLGEGTKLRHFFHEVTDWHRWLANREVGKPITGACNLAFLFLAISGVYLWFPRKWKWSSIKPVLFFKSANSAKARNFNWHNVIGIWSTPILIILTATGVIMSYQWANQLIYTLTKTEAPAPRGRGPGGPGGGPRRGPAETTLPAIGLTPFVTAIQTKAPDWHTITLNLPQKGGQGRREGGEGRPPRGEGEPRREGGEGGGERRQQGAPGLTAMVGTDHDRHLYARNTVTLSLTDTSIQKWEGYENFNTGRKIRSWVRGLHTGEVGGFIGQTLAGLASLGGAFLVYTGLALSWNRFFGKKRKTGLEKSNQSKAPVSPLP